MIDFRISSYPRSGYNFLVHNLDQAMPMHFGTIEYQHELINSDYRGMYVVVIRPPLETIRSEYVMNLHLNAYPEHHIPQKQIDVKLAHYILFYKSILKGKNKTIIDFNDLSFNPLNTVNYVLKTLGSNVVQGDVKVYSDRENNPHIPSSSIHKDYLMYDELILNSHAYETALECYKEVLMHKSAIDAPL